MTTSEATSHAQELIDAIDVACAILAAGATTDRARAIDEAILHLKAARRGEASTAPVAAALQQENLRLREQLTNANEQLRRRDDFLAVVTHELRNPLAPLSFAIDLLLTEASQDRLPAGEVLLRRLKMLRRQVGKLTADLNRLLDFSRIRSGHLDLRWEQVDLAQVVSEVIEEMKPQFEASRSELRVCSTGTERGLWDAMRLRQVVWNLLSNAAKFGAGSPVDVSVAGDEIEVHLSVRDRGPGIAEQERAQVFRRFERAGSGSHSGFGVGLWLVKQIVDALGGTVALDSETGYGATFTVVLPRRQHG
jgi:signal transduction histidine kinase